MLLVSIVLIYLLYLTIDLAKKMNTTMLGPFAGSSSMATTVFKATPLWPPLCDSMAEGTVKGFFQLCQLAKKQIN
jgi:hypothetical protein